MRRPGVLVAVILVVGVAGAVLALRSHEGNPEFVAQQQGILPVDRTGLQALLLTTDDPRPSHRGRASGATCTPGSAGALGNPWVCVVRYPQPPRIRFHVTVNADRSIDGAGRAEGAEVTVSGCCVQAP